MKEFENGQVWVTRNGIEVTIQKERIGTSEYFYLCGVFQKDNQTLKRTWRPDGSYNDPTWCARHNLDLIETKEK